MKTIYCLLGLLAAAVFCACPALAADGECDYVSDAAYRRLDPQEIGCVFTWIHDESVPNEGRCVELSVEKFSEAGEILLGLKNRCPHAVTFHEALLPWHASSGLEMLVVSPKSPETPLRGNNPPSFSMRRVVLGPGRSIRAVFPLDDRFPGFGRALQRRDLMLHWFFQFTPDAPEQEGGILFRALRSRGSGRTAQPAGEQEKTDPDEVGSEGQEGR